MDESAELDAIIAELHGLAERVGDLAMATLRVAIDAGATRRPEEERRLTRARAAIERAVALLEHHNRKNADED